MRKLILLITHLAALGIGFAAGIFALPILMAPPAPPLAAVEQASATAMFSGEFSRARAGSDFLHWGEGRVAIGDKSIALLGRVAPGPDYQLYLSPQFVEDEAQVLRIKDQMVRVGEVKTFENFLVEIPAGIRPADYNSIVIWCESFGEFITSARYQ